MIMMEDQEAKNKTERVMIVFPSESKYYQISESKFTSKARPIKIKGLENIFSVLIK